jgi:hypothetical protein
LVIVVKQGNLDMSVRFQIGKAGRVDKQGLGVIG